MARIRKIEIKNFRGIQSCSWIPSSGINCLIGPGDSGKSSMLDAIEFCVGARRTLQFSDADFHALDVEQPISITVTIGELSDALKSVEAYGLYVRSFDATTEQIDDEPERQHETVLSVRLANGARNFVSEQFGRDRKWTAINSAVWSAIRDRIDEELTLADVDQVAKASSAESNEVLAVLALLSRPASGLLKMEYVVNGESGKASLSGHKITKNLRGWWKDKTINDDEWRSWAGKVIVKWSPSDRGGL
jgi:hypothetical protein